jgi:hypothetical protein
MEVLVMALLERVVIPELARFMERKFAETGRLPTQEELTEHVNTIADRITGKGDPFIERLKADLQQ